MYFSQNRKAAERRAGDEYLRRMASAGRPDEEVLPTVSTPPEAVAPPVESAPQNPDVGQTPPLAMVYCPKQAFRKLYEPDVALSRGTLFAELDLPFEGRSVSRR